MERFSIKSERGYARTGELKVKGNKVETPHLFPLVSLYGGGLEGALFGGGIHRTIKEFMVDADRQPLEEDYSDLFKGIMTSVSSITDFHITEDKLWNNYLDEPFKEKEPFQDFDGFVFVDSGGFKILTQGSLEGKNFSIDVDQEKALEIQRKIGGDIIVNLDEPIMDSDTREERIAKARNTLENAKEFYENSKGEERIKYLTVHGYNKSALETFFEVADEYFPKKLDEYFDGIALGSLVPKSSDYETLIEAVTGCREIMEERGIEEMPLHILGISNGAIPLLMVLGADTFDSKTYFQQAYNGNYMTSLTNSVKLEDAREKELHECDCRVCNNEKLKEWMMNPESAPYKKDSTGAVAIHNLEIQTRDISRLRESIEEGEDEFRSAVENLTESRNDKFKDFTFTALDKSLGSFF